jgi:hypothetical protein
MPSRYTTYSPILEVVRDVCCSSLSGLTHSTYNSQRNEKNGTESPSYVYLSLLEITK